MIVQYGEKQTCQNRARLAYFHHWHTYTTDLGPRWHGFVFILRIPKNITYMTVQALTGMYFTYLDYTAVPTSINLISFILITYVK